MHPTRSTLGLLVLVLASLAAPAHAGDRAPADLAPVASASGLVSITVEGRPEPCAGVLARRDGLVVTARSLVADAGSLVVELPDGRRLPATRVAQDEQLALLRVKAPGALDLAAPSLATELPAPGAPVQLGRARATLGSPLAEGGGLLSAWTPCPGAVAPGTPLLSGDGALLGVTLGLEELPFLGPCLACVTAAPAEQVGRLLERADRPLPWLGFGLRLPRSRGH